MWPKSDTSIIECRAVKPIIREEKGGGSGSS